jgi:hypothetical protein
MKIIKLIKLILMLLFISSSWSCEENDRQTEKEDDEQTEMDPLKGTEWRLVGFVDAVTDKMKEAEPNDSRCYILIFETDSTVFQSLILWIVLMIIIVFFLLGQMEFYQDV